MKIRKVEANNRKAEFRVVTSSGDTYVFPYVKAEPPPGSDDKVEQVVADRELGREAFTYLLESGEEGSVHIEQVLEYNQDPTYLSELLLYKLTLEVRERADASGLSRRELARRLGTSLAQLYRLLDPANTRKSLNQMVALLHALDCDVDIVVTGKRDAQEALTPAPASPAGSPRSPRSPPCRGRRSRPPRPASGGKPGRE